MDFLPTMQYKVINNKGRAILHFVHFFSFRSKHNGPIGFQ